MQIYLYILRYDISISEGFYDKDHEISIISSKKTRPSLAPFRASKQSKPLWQQSRPAAQNCTTPLLRRLFTRGATQNSRPPRRQLSLHFHIY